MPERRKKRSSHPLRVAFRWCRILALVLLCAAVATVLWCNIFGVPDFVETAIRKEIQRRGIDLDFNHLRLRGFRHLVASDVRYGSGSTNAPTFTAREAEFIVDNARLKSGRLELSGLHLKQGHLTIPLDARSGRSLVVTNINTDVHFGAGDVVRVVDFSAEALGARARITGEVKHLWKFKFAPSSSDLATNNWQKHLLEVVEIAEQLDFKSAPELTISLLADGDDLANTRVSVLIRSDEATSKWGTFDRLQISSSIAPTRKNSAVRGDFLSEISGFRTRSGLLESLRVEGETYWTRNMERLLTNTVRLTSGGVDSRRFRFSNASAMLTSTQESSNAPIHSTFSFETGPIESSGTRIATNSFQAEVAHPLPFPTPAAWLAKLMAGRTAEPGQTNHLSGSWRLASSGVTAGAAAVETVQVWGDLRTHNRSEKSSSFIHQLQALWQILATNIRAGEIIIGSVESAGNWSFPEVTVTNLNAQLYGGYLKGVAQLNVQTRIATAETESDFPYEKLSALLDKPVQRWFAQFEWEDAPYIQSTASLQFPEWDREWKSLDILRTLQISGRLEGAGKFRGITVDKAESHLGFSNFVWTLPDLTIARPEGQAKITYSGNVTNADFYWKLDSRIDPAVIKPLFPKEQQPAVGIVKFVQPPHLLAEAWGNWDDDTRLGVRAFVAGTNFFVKEQAFTDLRADILITNALIHCFDVLVHRGKEEVRAPYIRVDLPGEIMFVTNIVSTLDPYIAMSLIGDEAYEAIDPYRFAEVPTVRVNGIVPLRHWSKADLRFEVAGNDFTFWRFRMPNVVGDVHWRADHIAFSNITANFYGGKARWSGYFIIDHKDDSANYSFAGYTTNTELKYLVADLTGETNQIEGILDGELIITSANSKNDRSWTGYGKANVKDGFLWNVPVFGVFSPVLDGIMPGLGASRITAGTGTFMITNSVVYTRDMQVRAPAFRLGYKGQVDLDGNLEAIVEAQIFRDAWIVGKLFSIALWPVSKAFEAKVSGTIDAPKTDLRFVPKFLLAPFRALNSLGEAGERRPDASAPRQESPNP